MSKLFEALSALNASRRAPKVVDPAAVLARDLIAASVVSPIAKQESKTEQHSPRAVSSGVAALAVPPPTPAQEVEVLTEAVSRPAENRGDPLFAKASPESRLVAFTDPNSLGAEKFRALVTRFDHLRKQSELKSFQVTSSVINEGKTVVAGNVAVTLAKYSGSKTLLVEGDLHRPTLADLFGLNELPGLSHWWFGQNQDLGQFVHRLSDMPLWFLSAGKACDQPSDILRSDRFQKAFAQLSSQFEWTVVDSTPMLPIVDANLWSRLVDGTLLVVREGLTPVKALERGLKALDHPKLIGVVVNDATEFDRLSYEGQYYGGSDGKKSAKNKKGYR